MLTSLLCSHSPHSFFIGLYKNRWVLSLLFSCFFPPNPHPQHLPHPLPHCHDKCPAWKLADIVSVCHLRIFCCMPLWANIFVTVHLSAPTASRQQLNVHENKWFIPQKSIEKKVQHSPDVESGIWLRIREFRDCFYSKDGFSDGFARVRFMCATSACSCVSSLTGALIFNTQSS